MGDPRLQLQKDYKSPRVRKLEGWGFRFTRMSGLMLKVKVWGSGLQKFWFNSLSQVSGNLLP